MVEIHAMKIPREIHEEQLDGLISFLTTEKQVKLTKLIHKKDLYRSLLGEIIIRFIIMKRYNMRNDNIKFIYNHFGKPDLYNHPDFSFNISHSGSWVICAINHQEIGIDIEEIKPLPYLSIASSCFAKEELEDIRMRNKEDQLRYFFDLWTLKESFIKFYGKGLAIPLKSFVIRKLSERKIEVYEKNKKLPLAFKQYYIDEHHKLSVCIKEGDFPRQICFWDCNRLYDEMQFE
ncbi:4'-phosphopantetheinyl transferase family protein [Virgibacillus proomii]|uniref:4'-phosphopantetheinyl transferase family protein n=1 Tax=Virgibacillus proomii TaxID=84407 RepID=UPI001C10B3B1|nr:4'-phosphopantetheinyl transferase superfamily protein [Virgibacillus proomii]MBU5265936.1 4'-phosphopantetheinyl transferase superfamily protein [Virgibacillus proomii]